VIWFCRGRPTRSRDTWRRTAGGSLQLNDGSLRFRRHLVLYLRDFGLDLGQRGVGVVFSFK